MLSFAKTVTDDTACYALSGHLDTVSAPKLDDDLQKVMPEVSHLVLDLADTDYISSAGLRVLLRCHKLMAGKGGMKLIHVSPMIMGILDMTGFSDLLTIE